MQKIYFLYHQNLKIPVLKDGVYKINADMTGKGNLIYSYNAEDTGHRFDLSLTESLTKDSNLYAWLKSDVNYLTINNTSSSDLGFKNITVDYIGGNKDYTDKTNNVVNISDLSKFKGQGEYKIPEFKNGYLRFYTSSSAEFNVTAPSKGTYLIVTETSSASGMGYYGINVSNLTNKTQAQEMITPLSDSISQDVYSPISVGTKTIELEEGTNVINFSNRDGILDMKSIKLLKVN